MKKHFLCAFMFLLITFCSTSTQLSANQGSTNSKEIQTSSSSNDSDRVRKLEQQVAELQAQVKELMKLAGRETGVGTQLPTTSTANSPMGGALSEAEKAALEAEFTGSMAGQKNGGKSAPPRFSSANAGNRLDFPPVAGISGGVGRLRLIDVSVSLLNDYSLSTADNAKFQKLQGGDHDPKNKGFSAPNEEFVLGGVVDHHFRGDLDLVSKVSEGGETELEIEEAYLTSLGLGHGLQVKAGTWFQDFGRLNNTHPHAWDFANQPVIYTRLMSKENMRSPGAQLSWLLPSNEYYKLHFAAQSPIGGTMASFRSEGGNDLSGTDNEHQLGGHSFSDLDVQGVRDMVFTSRLETSRMLSDEATILAGMSFSTGPNATGKDARTNLYGIDFYYKWKPLRNNHGWPFWAFQAEALKRDYGASSAPLFSDPTVILPKERLRDWGFYAHLIRGFKRQWTAGLRLEYANADGDKALDPLRDRRWRVSPNITHYFSEFSKIRYQYDYDVAEHLGDKPEHTFTLQYEVTFGAHGAHKF